MSLSARRAWIEISVKELNAHLYYVALRKESVDRNCDLEPIKNPEAVALRKESVDRNIFAGKAPYMENVALRKESVDRNLWWGVRKAVGSLVALRKESVDRNPCFYF